MKIYKYRLLGGHLTITRLNIPVGSKILKVGLQGIDYCIWFEINENEDNTETRHFYSIHTGSPFDTVDLDYVDTIIDSGYVIHIYEKRNFLSVDDMNLN